MNWGKIVLHFSIAAFVATMLMVLLTPFLMKFIDWWFDLILGKI